MKTKIHFRSHLRGYLSKLGTVREQKKKVSLGNPTRDLCTPIGRTSHFKGINIHIYSQIFTCKKFSQSLPSSTVRLKPQGQVVPTLGSLACSVQCSLLMPYNRRALLSTKRRSRTWAQGTLRTPAGEQGTLPNYSLVI